MNDDGLGFPIGTDPTGESAKSGNWKHGICTDLIGSMNDQIRINGDIFSSGIKWHAESRRQHPTNRMPAESDA